MPTLSVLDTAPAPSPPASAAVRLWRSRCRLLSVLRSVASISPAWAANLAVTSPTTTCGSTAEGEHPQKRPAHALACMHGAPALTLAAILPTSAGRVQRSHGGAALHGKRLHSSCGAHLRNLRARVSAEPRRAGAVQERAQRLQHARHVVAAHQFIPLSTGRPASCKGDCARYLAGTTGKRVQSAMPTACQQQRVTRAWLSWALAAWSCDMWSRCRAAASARCRMRPPAPVQARQAPAPVRMLLCRQASGEFL